MKHLFFSFFLLNAISINAQETEVKEENETESKAELLEIIDISAEFPGGQDAMISYIQRNITIPDSCIINTNNSKLQVKLLINSTGQVSKVELKADFLADICKQQIEQLFYEMPKWNPGLVGGKPVNKWIYIPVTFNFKEN